MKGCCIFIFAFAVIIPMGLLNPKAHDEITESPKDLIDGTCYEDDRESRLLPIYSSSTTNTPEKCKKKCDMAGYLYAGVQWGKECWCGNDKPPASKIQASSQCSMDCTGDASQKCGSISLMNIYKAGISTTTTTTTITAITTTTTTKTTTPRTTTTPDSSQLDVCGPDCDKPRHKNRNRYSITITNRLPRDVKGTIILLYITPEEENIEYKIRAGGVYESKLISYEAFVTVKADEVNSRKLWRDDGRCGYDFPLTNGDDGQCDPKGNDMTAPWGPCCSGTGWCGNTDAHCKCATCVDYSHSSEQTRKCKTYNQQGNTTFDFLEIVLSGNFDCIVKQYIPKPFKLDFKGYICG